MVLFFAENLNLEFVYCAWGKCVLQFLVLIFIFLFYWTKIHAPSEYWNHKCILILNCNGESTENNFWAEKNRQCNIMIVNLLMYHSFLIMLAFKELDYEIYYNLRGREEGNGIGFGISWDPSQTSTHLTYFWTWPPSRQAALVFQQFVCIGVYTFSLLSINNRFPSLLFPPCHSKENGWSHYFDQCMIRLDSQFFSLVF